jgi:hypothetical protein
MQLQRRRWRCIKYRIVTLLRQSTRKLLKENLPIENKIEIKVENWSSD